MSTAPPTVVDLARAGLALTRELEALDEQVARLHTERRRIIVRLYDEHGLSFDRIGCILNPEHPLSRQAIRKHYHYPEETYRYE